MVYRVFVEKKSEYAVNATKLKQELSLLKAAEGIKSLRIVLRYDIEGVNGEALDKCAKTVLSSDLLDNVYHEMPVGDNIIIVEDLPGQFDQLGYEAAENIQFAVGGELPAVKSAKVYIVDGDISAAGIDAVKKHIINPVEARETTSDLKNHVKENYPEAPPVKTIVGFIGMDEAALAETSEEYGIGMDLEDLICCRDYFKTEQRDPTITEIRMIDTYWSDHCRHTTFGTIINKADISDPAVNDAYQLYKELRQEVYGTESNKPQTLMDIAVIGAKTLKKRGVLQNLDESEEVNACSVEIKADNNGKPEDWYLLFKNETHNHPTEIEPFGGASTCLGGAIRDPLASRGNVYQAMRITGAANPLVPQEETIEGKLPQRKLVTTAAEGYSSYGNQIGLAGGYVNEIYHPGYVAKRMELGAVLGAVPKANVKREQPKEGDVVILLGGKTGRDGCGGATGSSKSHKTESLETCGAEVQKGNPPLERAIQRLFNKPEASRLIKRCNDFGAGGVSVAIGELADGLEINLDTVPVKYSGLDGTELAISESQERMAVVVGEDYLEEFTGYAANENVEATVVARVTALPRLKMAWKGDTIVDISREFLNSNGAKKYTEVSVEKMNAPVAAKPEGKSLQNKLELHMSDINRCGQMGLVERFDSTFGSGTVLMPYGGKHQMSPTQIMASKIPVEGSTNTTSGMAYGFDPYISEQNPYTGAYLAVADSVSKLVAAGYSAENMYLSFQEYFGKPGSKPERWGKPFAALLGALKAQMDLNIASVGGKDSMSGTFENIDVPPTLVSFAVAHGEIDNIISTEFKLPGSNIVLIQPDYQEDGITPQANSLNNVLEIVSSLIKSKKVLSAWAVGAGGTAEAIFKMSLGNRVGVKIDAGYNEQNFFKPAYGSFVMELNQPDSRGVCIGKTTSRFVIETNDETIDLLEVEEMYKTKLEPVFPFRNTGNKAVTVNIKNPVDKETVVSPKIGVAKPKALIPVFPGTNGEADLIKQLNVAGIEHELLIIKNQTPEDIEKGAQLLASRMQGCQLLILPGGTNGGAVSAAAMLRRPQVSAAVSDLMDSRDGLVLGLANGFRTLILSGLLPDGTITQQKELSVELAPNEIGRYQSRIVRTKIVSNLSPWLLCEEYGAIHTLPLSSYNARFEAVPEKLKSLIANGQVATQFVDLEGNPSVDVEFNPGGSVMAVEALTSPDGRILGKLCSSERGGQGLYLNIQGNKHQKLFESAVAYYKL